MAHGLSLGIMDMEPNLGMGFSWKSFCLPLLSVSLLYTTVTHALTCWCMVSFVEEECYLVDPASSHMLVSKIKPCMCKYEQIQTVKLRMAH
jgi:hypothetical protein